MTKACIDSKYADQAIDERACPTTLGAPSMTQSHRVMGDAQSRFFSLGTKLRKNSDLRSQTNDPVDGTVSRVKMNAKKRRP